MSATVIERGNLKLIYEPGDGHVVLERDVSQAPHTTMPPRIPLSFDDVAWIIHTAGPAALAAGQTITKENA